jgi:hypothetical protein
LAILATLQIITAILATLQIKLLNYLQGSENGRVVTIDHGRTINDTIKEF